MPETSAFDSPDVVTQVEDDDPESLAGDPIEFDPTSDEDEQGDD